MLQEIEKQVECENESVMLGLSPKSRRDLEMAASILQEYAETMLNPETQPYDKILKSNIDHLLDNFTRVFGQFKVQIIEKNFEPRPILKDQTVNQVKEALTEMTQEPKA